MKNLRHKLNSNAFLMSQFPYRSLIRTFPSRQVIEPSLSRIHERALIETI